MLDGMLTNFMFVGNHVRVIGNFLAISILILNPMPFNLSIITISLPRFRPVPLVIATQGHSNTSMDPGDLLDHIYWWRGFLKG